ncbi:DUF6113 family protein [Microbacterium sp. RU33B]|uniref:DUF6113 family protein n=1 Tax=Microbacterium sp. RU33B TaxID=1907390 RepID=UPI00096683CC|nr:DUF6113 family protein [Microbacterium sp. RU33B]SIT71673.1 hypothetical protein SAMN05880545_0910 [Microbacterium sp. RU33B]
MRSTVLPRVVTWVVAFVVGAVYGLAGTIAQGFELAWVPVGLIVAIAGTGALLAAVRLLTGDRWAALATGLGMMTATLIFSGKGPGGSVIVPQPVPGEFDAGIIWTIAVPLLVAVAVAWPERMRVARGA